MLKTNNVGVATQEALVALIKQLHSIPREIWIKEETLPNINKIAKNLNIRLLVVQKLLFLEDV